jgi:glutaredoxin-like YruB-family protein
MSVIVYSTPSCPYCAQAKSWLSQRGIAYEEKDVSVDSVAAYEMVRKTGQQGVPVIDIDGQYVVGFDRRRLELLLSQGSQKPTLGAAVADAARILVKQGKIPIFGAYIGKVTPGSPAARAGLQPGDVITQINVRPVNNASDVESAMNVVERGTTLRLTYLRGEKTLRGQAGV